MAKNETLTIIAGQDLDAAASQYKAVAGDDGLVAANGSEAAGIVGINKPKSGEHATLVYAGEYFCRVGSGGSAAGDRLTVVASGWFSKAYSGSYAVGRALDACASGGIVRCVVNFAVAGFQGS